MQLIGVVLAAAFLIAVLHWWSEGILETSDAFILAVVFCGLIFGLFAASNAWQFLIAFVPLSAAAAYVIYSYRAYGIRSYLKKRCDEYIRAIQFDPRNVGARECLARPLYDLGELDRAIDEMQVAVAMGAGIQSRYSLDRWIRERRLRDSPNAMCRWCMTENHSGSRTCSNCGAELPYESALARWIIGGRVAGTRFYLILLTGLAMVCVSVLVLPIKFAFIPLAACLVARNRQTIRTLRGVCCWFILSPLLSAW
ncbi:MAG: hypothetical protein ACP5R5_13565, partial [Armatimonadota bacterium]